MGNPVNESALNPAPTAVLGAAPVTTTDAGTGDLSPAVPPSTITGGATASDAPVKDAIKKLQPGSPEYLAEVFIYHAPTPDQIPKYEAVRHAARAFAEVIVANCPQSADRSDALRKIREAAMTANSAIALNGRA